MEIWKTINGFEDYEVSNLGRVKSLSRTVVRSNGRDQRFKEKILKNVVKHYLMVNLYKDKKSHTKTVHQLVAIAFLDHSPCGLELVVNHKDFNILNNNVYNLEIVTQRENTNQKHLKSSSKYTGVTNSGNKWKNKWRASIVIKGKLIHLGNYETEHEAHLVYEKKLKEILCN